MSLAPSDEEVRDPVNTKIFWMDLITRHEYQLPNIVKEAINGGKNQKRCLRWVEKFLYNTLVQEYYSLKMAYDEVNIIKNVNI